MTYSFRGINSYFILTKNKLVFHCFRSQIDVTVFQLFILKPLWNFFMFYNTSNNLNQKEEGGFSHTHTIKMLQRFKSETTGMSKPFSTRLDPVDATKLIYNKRRPHQLASTSWQQEGENKISPSSATAQDFYFVPLLKHRQRGTSIIRAPLLETKITVRSFFFSEKRDLGMENHFHVFIRLIFRNLIHCRDIQKLPNQ